MDIVYESYAGTTEPSSPQITISNSQFSDVKTDGNGALMRINVDTILMSITSSTFTSHSAGVKGGVFYIDELKKLTMSQVTATDFFAPSTGGGRFIYYSGTKAHTEDISNSVFTCKSTTFTSSTIQGRVNANTPDQGSGFEFYNAASSLTMTSLQT